jgi:hypothetical protein
MQVRWLGISLGVVFSGEGICLKGVRHDEKMDELLLDIQPYLFFPFRVCRKVERYENSMSKMRFLF